VAFEVLTVEAQPMSEEHLPLRDIHTLTSTGATLTPPLPSADLRSDLLDLPSDGLVSQDVLRRLDHLITVLESQAMRNTPQPAASDDAVVAFKERISKTVKLGIYGAFIANTCVSLLSLAEASYSSRGGKGFATYVTLYLALILSLTATSSSAFHAVRMESTTVNDDDFRRGLYAQAIFIFHTVPVFLFIATAALSAAVVLLMSDTQPPGIRIMIAATYLSLGVLLIFSVIHGYVHMHAIPP